MLGHDSTLQPVVGVGGPQAALPSRPQPEVRVVETAAKSDLQKQQTRSTSTNGQTGKDQFVKSVRRFADVLDSTGNVWVASSVSGFRTSGLDIYA